MAIIPNNYINNQHNVAKRMKGFANMEFSWGWQYFNDQPSMEFLDIVLPSPIIQFESTDMHFFAGINRFWGSPSGMMNYFLFAGKGREPSGRDPLEGLGLDGAGAPPGFADKYNPKMLDVTDWREWDEQVIERIYKPAYEEWAKDETGILAYNGIEPRPWDEFVKLPIVRVPGEPGEWFYPFKNTVEWDRSPFKTPSGKTEFESSYVKNNDLTKTRYGGLYDAYPRWQPTYQDLPANDSYYHPWTQNYPLSMVTPVSTYRQHSANDQNPWLKGDCYEHMVRMSPQTPPTAASRRATACWSTTSSARSRSRHTFPPSCSLARFPSPMASGPSSTTSARRSSCPTASTPQATATCSSATPICRTSSARC